MEDNVLPIIWINNKKILCLHNCLHTVGEKLFDPWLILYICPLTKKLSVYNFNGRFIWTVNKKKSTKFQKNALIKKS